MNKPYPSYEDLKIGDIIKIEYNLRLTNFSGSLLVKVLKGDILTYKGKAKNELCDNDWLQFEDESGNVGIIFPNALINCFQFVKKIRRMK